MEKSEIKIGDKVIAPPLAIKGTVTHITDKGMESPPKAIAGHTNPVNLSYKQNKYRPTSKETK